MVLPLGSSSYDSFSSANPLGRTGASGFAWAKSKFGGCGLASVGLYSGKGVKKTK